VKQDRSPVATETVRLVLALLLSTVVTGVLGIVFKDTLEQMRDQLGLVGVSFILTGLLLFGTKFRAKPGPDALPYPPNLWIFALVLGLAQAVAITPGISRSGTTVCVALLLGGGKEKSVEYSFLMSIPAILGATILEMKDAQIQIAAIPALAGFIAAMVSGLVFLWMLLWIVRKGKLYQFSFYTIPLGIWVIWFSLR
jgi:undecaprenyl-diphosphatase